MPWSSLHLFIDRFWKRSPLDAASESSFRDFQTRYMWTRRRSGQCKPQARGKRNIAFKRYEAYRSAVCMAGPNLKSYIMSKEIKPLYETYVPRHMRLNCVGFYTDATPRVSLHEIVETVPVVDGNGRTIAEKRVVVKKPAHEVLSKWKYEDFRLENLLAAGVPLEEVDFSLMSRSACDNLVLKALDLGLLSEEFSLSVPESVEPLKPENNE